MTELDPILFEGIFIAMPDGAHPLANNESFLKRFGRERSAERLTRLTNELEWPLGVLDAALAGGDWLGGDRFTATDLNVSVVLGWTTLFPGALKPFPNIQVRPPTLSLLRLRALSCCRLTPMHAVGPVDASGLDGTLLRPPTLPVPQREARLYDGRPWFDRGAPTLCLQLGRNG